MALPKRAPVPSLWQKIQVLFKTPIEAIVFTGIATDNTILYGANTAMTHGLKVTIAHDACAAATQTQHEQALSMIKGRSSNDILSTLAFISK